MKVHTWVGRTIAASILNRAWTHPAVFSPRGHDDVSFTITIPNETNSSVANALLFRIQSRASMQWVALGQGDQMAGANMFVVYASSSSNNVTVSPRSGTGHVPPQFNPQSRVSLLPESGASGDGTLTANFRCDGCLNTHGGPMSAADSASKWIWAYKEGSPMESDDVSAAIVYHDAFGQEVIDLTRARSTSSNINQNPFRGANSDAIITTDQEEPSTSESWGIPSTAIAHGCLMAIAFVLLFPTFALFLPLSAFVPMPATTAHAVLQAFSLVTAITGLALGLKLWTDYGTTPDAHPIIGLVVVASLVLVQPVLGWLQHRYFKLTGGKGWFGYVHRWLGRSMILLGVVNGGLGFWWVGVSTEPLKTGMIVYSAFAGVVFVVYVTALIGIRRMKTGWRREEQQAIALEDETDAGIPNISKRNVS